MTRIRRQSLIGFAIGIVLFTLQSFSIAQTSEYSLATAFTYQGRLQHQGLPAEGVFDITFDLWDAAVEGRFLGRVDRFDVQVRSGVFAVELDFGRNLAGEVSPWLEIQVRPAGGDSYTDASPKTENPG